MWKKWFDPLAAVIGIMVLSPVLVIIIISILVLEGKPILFKQERIGLNKNPFQIYKFRTMHEGKITRVGNILRKTGLDELAQIFNILRGEMSVVGARPLTLNDIERLKWNDVYHSKRWSIKPGITGVAQLYGGRGAKISWLMDEYYRKNASLLLDIKIILLSFAVNILGKYRVRVWLYHRKSMSLRYR